MVLHLPSMPVSFKGPLVETLERGGVLGSKKNVGLEDIVPPQESLMKHMERRRVLKKPDLDRV